METKKQSSEKLNRLERQLQFAKGTAETIKILREISKQEKIEGFCPTTQDFMPELELEM